MRAFRRLARLFRRLKGRGGAVLAAGAAQAQRIGHHNDTGAGHGGPGDHGVEQSGRRQRNRRHIVGEGPEQVLLDNAQRIPADPDGVHDGAQIGAHENDIGGLNGHIRPRAHGEAQALHPGLGQGSGVVDAVAHHAHVPPAVLKGGDDVALVPGQDLGAHVLGPDPHLGGHPRGRPGVVPGEQDGAHPEFAQPADRLAGGGADGVAHRQDGFGAQRAPALIKCVLFEIIIPYSPSYLFIDLIIKIFHTSLQHVQFHQQSYLKKSACPLSGSNKVPNI